MSKSYELVTIPQTSVSTRLYSPLFKQSYLFPSWALLVRVLNLSEALVLAPCHCLLSCSLSMVTFKPTCTLFASLLTRTLTTFPTLCLQVPTAVFSVLLVLCHVQAGDMHAYFLPDHVCHSSGVMLSMHNKTALLNHVFLSLRMSIMFHLVRQTNGHTDTRSDELPLNEQMWGLLTLAPNKKFISWNPI